MSIRRNLEIIQENIPDGVRLVAISKFHPNEAIMEAYEAGQRVFGESRMQELNSKHTQLPQDIEWHFVGHLQTNKVKTILPYVHTVHSIDSLKLLNEIENQASVLDKKIVCLLEIHIGEEDSKYGFGADELFRLMDEGAFKAYDNVIIGGVMGMATNTDDEEQIRGEFRKLRSIFADLKKTHYPDDERFREISMGMSADYKIAISEGSTMVRIGSSIFGDRQ